MILRLPLLLLSALDLAPDSIRQVVEPNHSAAADVTKASNLRLH
jgi:hypothetical protein